MTMSNHQADIESPNVELPRGPTSSLTKSWLKQYFVDSNFPEWTKSSVGITTPLTLPDNKGMAEDNPNTGFGCEREAECLIPNCNERYVVPKQEKEYLAHLLKLHQIVIGEINTVSDLPSYTKYWRNKFERRFEEIQANGQVGCDKTVLNNVLLEYMTCLQTEVPETENHLSNDKSGEASKQEFYFLSDVLPEDKELRTELQMKKLQHVLDVQESERNNFTNFNRCCLFCRTNFQAVPHSNLFDHMAFEHNFSVGKPDNLVYINDLLNLLEEKLEKMVCIYCEKVFKSREVLKEHMRKKNHKKINPRNYTYDKFYIVNYLEFGKSWKEVEKEREENIFTEEDLPTGFDDDNDDDSIEDTEDRDETDDDSIISSEVSKGEDQEDDWYDWRKYLPGFVCLFCPATYSNCGNGANDLFNHMKVVHEFDFIKIKETMKLSFYQQVKLVNYIRRQVHLGACIFCDETIEKRKHSDETYKENLLNHMKIENHMRLPDDQSEWDQSQYLFPTYENDTLLSYLPDEDDDSSKAKDLSEFSKLAIKQKERATKKGKQRISSTSTEPDVPVIAETFPVESESSARESILSQPEIRQILRPRQQSYNSPVYKKSSQGPTSSRRS